MSLAKLKEIGLSLGQIKVYGALLELGPTRLNRLQEKTGIERRNIYDILTKLMEKGLVTSVKEDKNKVFEPTSPGNLMEAIQQKKKALKELEQEMAQIKLIRNPDQVGATVYRGNDSMKTLLEEILKEKTSYWIGGNGEVEKTSIRSWFKRWMKRRVEKKKMMYDLVDYGTYLEDLKPGDLKKHKESYYKYRSLPKSLSSPMVVILFGNKVAQILWSEQSFAFVIESKKIKKSFLKYFNYFWKEPY